MAKKSFNSKQKLLLLFLSTAILEYNKKDLEEAKSVLYRTLWVRIQIGIPPFPLKKNIEDMSLKEINKTLKILFSDKERLNGLVQYSAFALKLAKEIKIKRSKRVLELMGNTAILLELLKTGKFKKEAYNKLSNKLGEILYVVHLSKLDKEKFEKKYKTQKSQKSLIDKYKKPKEMIKIVNRFSLLIQAIAKEIKIDLFKVKLF